MRRLVFLLLVLAACSDGKRESASLVAAVDRYRKAENDQKPEMADDVQKVVCTDKDVCAAKEACVKVTDATAKGLRLKREVEQGVDDIKQGKLSPYDPKAREIAGKLGDAQRLLDDGHAALPACDEKLLALRLKYGL